MALLNASKTYLTETYLHKWIETAGKHISIDVAWGTGFDPLRRMRIVCNKCNQTLTCDIPETPEKLDWSMQKFVGLHQHLTPVEAQTILKDYDTYKKAMTADFKPVKPRALIHKGGRRFRETN